MNKTEAIEFLCERGLKRIVARQKLIDGNGTHFILAPFRTGKGKHSQYHVLPLTKSPVAAARKPNFELSGADYKLLWNEFAGEEELNLVQRGLLPREEKLWVLGLINSRRKDAGIYVESVRKHLKDLKNAAIVWGYGDALWDEFSNDTGNTKKKRTITYKQFECLERYFRAVSTDREDPSYITEEVASKKFQEIRRYVEKNQGKGFVKAMLSSQSDLDANIRHESDATSSLFQQIAEMIVCTFWPAYGPRLLPWVMYGSTMTTAPPLWPRTGKIVEAIENLGWQAFNHKKDIFFFCSPLMEYIGDLFLAAIESGSTKKEIKSMKVEATFYELKELFSTWLRSGTSVSPVEVMTVKSHGSE